MLHILICNYCSPWHLEVTLETTQEKIRDAKQRSLLLKAYSTRVTAERQQLNKKAAQVKGRLEQLEEKYGLRF